MFPSSQGYRGHCPIEYPEKNTLSHSSCVHDTQSLTSFPESWLLSHFSATFPGALWAVFPASFSRLPFCCPEQSLKCGPGPFINFLNQSKDQFYTKVVKALRIVEGGYSKRKEN